ncbi:DapH/DapD/GlmU-related protein [Streptococcus porcinus]|uniref:CpsI n=1 Tax=Streptococcus porcinus TaxID=1340 RepID=A0A4V0H8Z2_STRPO|nr:DapH/DapD/GlmU-related protein [Streptococcus porcinus]VTT43217.1 CpsI [Streptococcus porcinus]VTT44716.1 CpsI [Streptococcus porcinus]
MNRTSNYNLIEKIQIIIFLSITKIFFSTARLIRFPFVVRGKKYIDFGERLTLGRYCRFDVLGSHATKVLKFGKNVNIGDSVRISCIEKINIGDNVLIGSRVLIIDNSHGSYSGHEQDNPGMSPNERRLISSPIVIGDNVWIGDGVVIQKGVTIGDGAVIGANSVVTKNIPTNTISVGIPANPKKIFNKEKSKWVNFENEVIS